MVTMLVMEKVSIGLKVLKLGKEVPLNPGEKRMVTGPCYIPEEIHS